MGLLSFIPPFMRHPTYAILGVTGVGVLAYNIFRQNTDRKLKHPLIRESVLLMQNNDDIVQAIGVPIVVESSLGSRVAIADDRANFSYKVKGPRGKINVEVAGMSAKLNELGPNIKGQTFIQQQQAAGAKDPRTGEAYALTTNLPEYNYNDFYVPDQQVVAEYLGLAQPVVPSDQQLLDRDSKFWKYEYLMAEMDKDLRILVAPNEKITSQSEPILYRQTYADLKNEFSNRLKTYRVIDSNMTHEEKEEFRRFKQQEQLQSIGYIRTYMMLGMAFFAMNCYILFRQFKRLPVINSALNENLKTLVGRNTQFRQQVPGFYNIHWVGYTIGSRIADRAKYSIAFMTHDNYGVVHFDGQYIETRGSWKINEIRIEIKDKKGDPAGPIIKIIDGPEL